MTVTIAISRRHRPRVQAVVVIVDHRQAFVLQHWNKPKRLVVAKHIRLSRLESISYSTADSSSKQEELIIKNDWTVTFAKPAIPDLKRVSNQAVVARKR